MIYRSIFGSKSASGFPFGSKITLECSLCVDLWILEVGFRARIPWVNKYVKAIGRSKSKITVAKNSSTPGVPLSSPTRVLIRRNVA